MTDEEKERLRAKKVEAVETLQSISIASYNLAKVDSRLNSYTKEVQRHPERHNLFEVLAVVRFFAMCKKYGINRTEVMRFFLLYESLYFPGIKGMQKYKLTPVQAFQFASIYGFWDGDKRIVHEAVLFVPRKFSKTTSSAAVAVNDLLFGDANSESYTAANSHDQALKCFEAIRGCMQRLDPKESLYTINQQEIKSRRKDRQSFAQVLTSNSRTKDGLNASTVIMDEFSQARDAQLLTVLTTSMGVRKNPLTMIITTASDCYEGPFYEMLQGYKEILLGSHDDDSLFIHLFEPDVDDDESDENTWKKVHPHIGVTVSLEFYRREYQKALRSSEQMLAFRTKLLNVYSVNESKAWISSTLARECALPIKIDGLKGRPDAMVAVDLSESDDFTSVSMGLYDAKNKSFYFHTAYFFPEGALPGHVNEKLYRTWVQSGDLMLTPGDVIDYGKIVSYILWLNNYVKILQVGYDPWKSQEMINMLAASGARNVLKPVKQTYGVFTAPVESFEHGIKTGRIHINENPINYFCFGNAVLDVDRLENTKPIKARHSQKIDGVITKLMCMRLFIDYVR